MKHIVSLIFKVFLLAVAVIACIVFYLYTIGFFAVSPCVGLVASPGGKAYRDASARERTRAGRCVELPTPQPEESPVEAAGRFLDSGASVLIVLQDSTSVSSALLTEAATAGATVLFVGDSPDDATLSSSANLWYLGSLASYGGELLGQVIAMDYRDGTISDANGDLLLQYYLYQSDPDADESDLASSALAECEHYGVYTARVEYTGEEGAALSFDAQSLDGQTPPEIILCTSVPDAQAALETAASLGWLEGEQPVRIYAAADTPEEADALVAAGAQAVAHFDPVAMGETAAQMALNALDHRFPGLDTGLTADEAGRFTLPYGLSE